ncbi:MAG: hypothetical protein R3200_00170 [Xanthomonadales bacterium]|nr:hypothetical protein [Xanthomonadales bacterium]
MSKKLLSLALLGALLAGSGCASKQNRIYIGQCAVPGHWFCGKIYDSRAQCNNDRKKHDFETSLPGTCYSGDPRGRPDTRTM